VGYSWHSQRAFLLIFIILQQSMKDFAKTYVTIPKTILTPTLTCHLKFLDNVAPSI
jgi:hypothetical protein